MWLRTKLAAMEVPRPERYGLHSLRRGAAREFAARGGSAAELCLAGSWSSAKAYQKYLSVQRLEMVAFQRVCSQRASISLFH